MLYRIQGDSGSRRSRRTDPRSIPQGRNGADPSERRHAKPVDRHRRRLVSRIVQVGNAATISVITTHPDPSHQHRIMGSDTYQHDDQQ